MARHLAVNQAKLIKFLAGSSPALGANFNSNADVVQ